MLIAYLLFGLFLSYIAQTDEGPVILNDGILSVIIVVAWPVVILMSIPRVNKLTFQGKVIWEKDKKS